MRGQAATELAIFGAIVIFLLGAIIRVVVSSGQGQDVSLKTARYALLQSYKAGQNQETNRSNASVVFIEDRLSPDFGKYGAVERAPFMAQGSGTMTPHLMMPLDETELQDPRHLPVMDFFINGQHFAFSTGRIMHKAVAPGAIFYQIVANMDNSTAGTGNSDPSQAARQEMLEKKFCVADPCPGILSVAQRFDLNRNGNFSDDPLPSQYNDMAWQWRGVQAIKGKTDQDKALYIDGGHGIYPSFDVDGDGKEETIYAFDFNGNDISGVTVFDFQDGDLDLTGDDFASGRAGLLSNMAIYTKPAFGSPQGNYLKMQQGKAWGLDGKFIRSVSREDQADLVERKIQLSNDTGRMCDGSVPDVEVCGDCFSVNNIARTCFDNASKILYVRSRLLDKQGHFWRTDASGQLHL